jgi:hypothetical protein
MNKHEFIESCEKNDAARNQLIEDATKKKFPEVQEITFDAIRPKHYGGEVNPFEPLKIIEYYNLNFAMGNVLKYSLRAGRKDPSKEIEDLEKAQFYLNRQIQKLKDQKNEGKN